MLDLYPKLRMASSSRTRSWLPHLLEHWDRLFKLYANERRVKTDRLPSEAFYAQCFIAFESDESPSSGSGTTSRTSASGPRTRTTTTVPTRGARSARCARLGVPEPVQAKLLGGNARRMYGIEAKMFVTDEPEPLDRPDWFPGGAELDEWAELVADPRRHAEALASTSDNVVDQNNRTAGQFARARRAAA